MPKLQSRNRQVRPNGVALVKSRLQIDPVEPLPRIQLDQASVLHAGVADVDLELPVADGLFAQFDLAKSVVVLMVPVLAGSQRLVPGAIRRLEVLGPQKESLAPVNREVMHGTRYYRSALLAKPAAFNECLTTARNYADF